MATRNGAPFLRDQLNSIARQSHKNWGLWVSDDESTDQTIDIVKSFASNHPGHDVQILQGPKQGTSANFMSLLRLPELPEGPVAFADQDDIWEEHRLRAGLERVKGNIPKLSCGLRKMINEKNEPLEKLDPAKLAPFCFKNALVQNTVAGNTITLNTAVCDVLRNDPKPEGLAFHDWWIYLRFTAADIEISSDPTPHVLWRQHSKNTLGYTQMHRTQRVKMVFRGTWSKWVNSNIRNLLALPDTAITPSARAAALALSEDPIRLRGLIKSGAYRHSTKENVFLKAMAILHKI